MPRQGRIQSGTGVNHVMLRRINHQNPVKAGVVSRVSEYEFTSWHEYLGREGFFPLCNVNVVLGRIRIDELTALIDAPLDNDVSCIEYEEGRERSMSDYSVSSASKTSLVSPTVSKFRSLVRMSET